MHIARPLFHRTIARGAAALLLLAAAACGDSGNPAGPGNGPIVQPPVTPVAEVDLSATELLLPVGDQHQLFVSLKAADGSEIVGRAVAWASSDPSVVTVDGAGRLTGIRGGTATISATSEGKRDEALVRVPTPVATVTLNAEYLPMKPGDTRRLQASLASAEGQVITDRLISWISSDPTVASVDGEGAVTGVRGGYAWVHAISEGKSDSVKVSVSMTADPNVYNLISVDGLGVGIDKVRVDSVTWTDPQGVAHPAEVKIFDGTLTFIREGGRLLYEQRITLATFLLAVNPGEISVPVAERVLVDRGEVTERPGGGFDYLFRSGIVPDNHYFFGVRIGVERISTDQVINGEGHPHRLIFSQW
jgi:hypothetical protein